MHIPDGLLDPYLCILLYIISLAFLMWAWKGVKKMFSRSFVPVMAVSSALIFIAQMINFPIAGGTCGHLMGGTLLGMLLGPHATIISMTIVLLIQALLFADGGITTLGANIFNMAVIGGLSFYLVKLLIGASSSQKRFTAALFIASWLSVVLTALLTAIQIGVSPSFASAGGLMTTMPAMLSVHIIIGVIEAAITAPLILQLSHASPTLLNGLNIIRGVNNEPHH